MENKAKDKTNKLSDEVMDGVSGGKLSTYSWTCPNCGVTYTETIKGALDLDRSMHHCNSNKIPGEIAHIDPDIISKLF